jgi:polyribonucleotide nucleotidyltransferase
MSKQVFELDFNNSTLIVETGEIARQAGGSVLIRYEDTVILSTATASKVAKDLDFFPLTVLFEEKLYSAGKIPGGFLRREGRPSEHATLTSRLIDRTIRPLFAEGFRNEVQVVNTVLSVDQDYSSEVAGMLGASLSLCVSDIPFEGPIAGVNVGYIDGQFILNPTAEQTEQSDIQLTVAGTKDAINMVEAQANEVSEEIMLEAMMFGHEAIKKLCDFQIEIASQVSKEKMEIKLYQIDESIKNEIAEKYETQLREAVAIHEKLKRYGKIDEITDEAVSYFESLE